MTRIWGVIAGLVLLAAGFAWGVACAQFGAFPHTLLAKTLDYRNPLIAARRNYFAAKHDRPQIAFVGDSIFRSIEWGEEFPDLRVANRAIDGDTTADVLARIGGLKRLNAQEYVIMLGTDDVGHGVPTAQTVANIQRIVAELPGKKIVMAVTPCNRTYPSCDQAPIDRLNFDLRNLKGAEFAPVTLDPGRDLADMVHPNAGGMEAIAEAVHPLLDASLHQNASITKPSP